MGQTRHIFVYLRSFRNAKTNVAKWEYVTINDNGVLGIRTRGNIVQHCFVI